MNKQAMKGLIDKWLDECHHTVEKVKKSEDIHERERYTVDAYNTLARIVELQYTLLFLEEE